MKRLNRLLIVFIVGVFLLSCNDQWDDHFSASGTGGVSENMYEFISANGDYSEFKKLIDSSGLNVLFTENLEKTVFIPTNAVFQYDLGLDSLGAVQLLQNYLVPGAKYSNALNVPEMKAYSNKMLNLKVVDDGKRTVNDIEYNFKVKVTNGVIYEIEDIYKPTLNLHEYILSLDDTHSIVRDYVIDANDTLFVPGKSRPIGINSVGETLYDSVFEIQNNFLNGLNKVSDEDRKYSMFISSDIVIRKAIKAVNDASFGSTGEYLSQERLEDLENWCIRTMFYRHIVDYDDLDLTKDCNLMTTTNGDFRIADGLQEIDTDYTKLSNGRSYTVTNLHIPKSKYLEQVRFDCRGVTTASKPAIDAGYMRETSVVAADGYAVDPNGPIAWFDYPTDVRDAEGKNGLWPRTVAFDTWRLDLDHNVHDATIVPGEYEIDRLLVQTDVGYAIWEWMGDFQIEIGSVLPEYEDERILILKHPSYWDRVNKNKKDLIDEFASYDPDKMIVPGEPGGNAGTYTIPSHWGTNKLRFYITVPENDGRPQWGTTLGVWFGFAQFTPTKNNY